MLRSDGSMAFSVLVYQTSFCRETNGGVTKCQLFSYAVKKLNERAICLGVISMWCTNERKPIAAQTKAFEENVNNTLRLGQSVSIMEN